MEWMPKHHIHIPLELTVQVLTMGFWPTYKVHERLSLNKFQVLSRFLVGLYQRMKLSHTLYYQSSTKYRLLLILLGISETNQKFSNINTFIS